MTPAQTLHHLLAAPGHATIAAWNHLTTYQRASLNTGPGALYHKLEKGLPARYQVAEDLKVVAPRTGGKWGVDVPVHNPGPAAIEGAEHAAGSVAAGLRNWPHTHR